MGVDYVVWTIPKDRSFRPDAQRVADLANGLRSGRWAPSPGAEGQRSQVVELLPGKDGPASKKPIRAQELPEEAFTASWIEFHSHHELVLDWHVQDMHAAKVQYPFTFDPFPDAGPPYFYIRLILGDEYFYWTGENVMPFEEGATRCGCHEQLAYHTGWAHGVPSQRIHRVCQKCGRSFDPSGIACEVQDGWTGVPQWLQGGLTFHFALIVDCHKYWPRDEEAFRRFQLRPDFLDLWTTHIGAPHEQVVTAD